MFITVVPIIKLFAWGEGDSGGHVLRETTSRGLCGLVYPSRTSKRGEEGDCVKDGGGGEGERERERVLGMLLCLLFITAVPTTRSCSNKHTHEEKREKVTDSLTYSP